MFSFMYRNDSTGRGRKKARTEPSTYISVEATNCMELILFDKLVIAYLLIAVAPQ
jgi:hypothetical protein